MAKAITLLSSCSGLNNKIDPVRLRIDPDRGLSELAVAYNVDIDSSGRINRRKGFKKVVDGECHSLFPYENGYLVVRNGVLSYLDHDYSCHGICLLKGSGKVSYAPVGDKVYFTNGYQKGYIKGKEVFPWEFIEYVGPPTTRVFYGPPLGHLIKVYNGFMFIAQDSVVWYSMPFSYHSYCLSEDYILFDSKIRMLNAVKDGLYVSTENGVYYLRGSDPRKFIQLRVCDHPAIAGTDTIVDGRKIGNGEFGENILIWASGKGICIGGPEGVFKNLTERKLVYPSYNEGAGTCIDNRYVCLMR